MITVIPEIFRERYMPIIDDPEAFFSSLDSLLPRAFRVNTLKAEARHIKERFEGYGINLTPVSWYEQAFISDEPEVGSSLEHLTGEIYVQELVSMLPPLLIKDEIKGKTVLDGCAAPGSKTTQLAALMENTGLLIANDVSYSRIKALKFNQEKTGAVNTVITNKDLRHFPKMEFDAVILDAPCSAEGTIRKSYGISSLWSEKHIRTLSKLQQQLIVKGFDLLKPGGAMVYSTCTFAPEENEAVVHHLLDQRPEARLEDIEIPQFRLSAPVMDWKGESFSAEVGKARRIWPHHNNTGGFFLAKVRK